MYRFVARVLGIATLCSAGHVAAEPENDETGVRDEAPAPAPQDKNYSHALQLGLRASVLGGYRMVFRYDDSPLCTEPDFSKSLSDQQKFCGHMGPAMLDVAASFAPFGGVEPFIMGRFGLVGESPTNTLKIFVEPSVGVEFEQGAGAEEWTFNGAFDPQYKTDVIFRAALGPQFDFARGVGAYVQVFGMSVGVLRYIHATMEFGAGIQARFP